MHDDTSFVIVDPRPIHREGLVAILKGAGARSCHAVGCFRELQNIVHVLPARPIILIEVRENLDGFGDVIEELRAVLPGCRIALLSPDCSVALVAQAVKARLDALFDENMDCAALVKALELVALGETVFLAPAAFKHWKMASAAQQDAGSPEQRLSSRERQVLCALTAGQPNKVIARACGITESTVKVHVKAILRKIHVTNRTQAAIWAQRFSADAQESADADQAPAAPLLRLLHSDAMNVPVGVGRPPLSSLVSVTAGAAEKPA